MNLIVKRPSDCRDAELTQFHALVASGGKVAIDGLRERIEEVHSLGFCFDGPRLVGVVGLKRPEAEYKPTCSTRPGQRSSPTSFWKSVGRTRKSPIGGRESLPLCSECCWPKRTRPSLQRPESITTPAGACSPGVAFSGEGQPYAGRTSQIVLYVRRIDETLLCD